MIVHLADGFELSGALCRGLQQIVVCGKLLFPPPPDASLGPRLTISLFSLRALNMRCSSSSFAWAASSSALRASSAVWRSWLARLKG